MLVWLKGWVVVRRAEGFDFRVIIPGHCTGWRAVDRFIAAFGETTVDPMAVGSRQSF